MSLGTSLRRLAMVAIVGTGLAAAAYAQDKTHDPSRVEYVRVPLYSVFHPDPAAGEATLQRGLYVGGPRVASQDFRIPVDLPVGATILEVGIIGQTSNQMTVRLERMDWAPVYAVGETASKEAGSWGCISVVEKGLLRKVGKPTPDNDQIPLAKREFEEQEFLVVVSLARSPNMTPEEKRAPVHIQRDRVTALWIKIAR